MFSDKCLLISRKKMHYLPYYNMRLSIGSTISTESTTCLCIFWLKKEKYDKIYYFYIIYIYIYIWDYILSFQKM